MVKLSEQNDYFMVATHHFTISMIIWPYIIQSKKEKGIQLLEQLKHLSMKIQKVTSKSAITAKN